MLFVDLTAKEGTLLGCRPDFESIAPVLLHGPNLEQRVTDLQARNRCGSSCFSLNTEESWMSPEDRRGWRTIRAVAAVAQW
jgi:hypothetical protein